MKLPMNVDRRGLRIICVHPRASAVVLVQVSANTATYSTRWPGWGRVTLDGALACRASAGIPF
ncbi:MAG: hypothetical protein Q8Q12_20850 [bacterium]|nr:hypothetical protein [bacterium]